MSRHANTRCYAVGCMNDNHNQAIDGEAKAKPEVIKLGLDLHARQVTGGVRVPVCQQRRPGGKHAATDRCRLRCCLL